MEQEEEVRSDRKIVFGAISKEAAARATAAVKSGASRFKFKEGNNIIRLLPPDVGGEPWVITYQHYFENVGGGKKGFGFNCPREMGQGKCPACEQYDKLMATGNPIDAERAKDRYKPRARMFMPIIDRSDEAAGVQVMAFGSMIMEQINELMQNEDVYGQDPAHPLEGDDLVVKRYEDKGYTKYKVNIRAGSHDRLAKTDEQIIKWLETKPNLQPFAHVFSYEEIKHKNDEMVAEAKGTPPPPPLVRPKSQQALPSGGETASMDDTGMEEGNTIEQGAASNEGQTADTNF